MKRISVLAGFVLLASSLPARADFELTAPDGRTVILKDNFTWQYKPAASQDGGMLVDNWNRDACSFTGSAGFTLSRDAQVSRVITWYSWEGAQQSASAGLYSSAGATIVAGQIRRGSCDPYQTQWCEGILAVGQTLPAGQYVLQAMPPRICHNAGSAGQGFIRVEGASSGSAPGSGAVPVPGGGVIGTNGWTVSPGRLEQREGGIYVNAPGDGETSYFEAPASVLGDWRGRSALSFEKKSTGGSYYASGYGAIGDVLIESGGMRASYRIPQDHSNEWRGYTVPLDGPGWALSGGATSLADILANVTRLRVRAEYGVGDDFAWLRNVVLR